MHETSCSLLAGNSLFTTSHQLYPNGDKLFPASWDSDLKLFVNLQLCLGKLSCSWTSTETEIALPWHADEHTVCKIAAAVLQLPLWGTDLSLLVLSPLAVTKWRHLPPFLSVLPIPACTWPSPVDQYPQLQWEPAQGERAPHWQVSLWYWHVVQGVQATSIWKVPRKAHFWTKESLLPSWSCFVARNNKRTLESNLTLLSFLELGQWSWRAQIN